MVRFSSDSNLALVVRKCILTNAEREKVTFLNRGEVGQASSLTGYELHEAVVKRARLITTSTHFLNKPERPILLAMSPGLNFVVSFLACIYAGVTCVPVPVAKSRLPLERLKNILKGCNSAEIICDRTGKGTFEMLLSEQDIQEEVKIIDVTELPDPEEIREDELKGFEQNIQENVYIQYTSGSSRDPKGVVLNSWSVLNNGELVGELWDIGEHTVHGIWLPHYHDMGLGSMLFTLINGGHFVIMSPLSFVQRPLRWLKMISEFKVTMSGAPPFGFNLCLKETTAEDLEGIDLSSWKYAFCGSETVPRALLNAFRDKFSTYGLDRNAVYACYGMAEVKLYIGGQPHRDSFGELEPENSLVEPTWLTHRSYDSIRIIDPETNEVLSDNREGEIWIQSESIGSGYLMPSEQLKPQFDNTLFTAKHPELEGTWLKTGDLGLVVRNQLYILGRIKDTIKVNGQNVTPSDLEWYAGEVHEELNALGAAAFRSSLTEEGKAHLLIELNISRPKSIDSAKAVEQIRSKIQRLFSVELDDVLILRRGTLERTSSGKVRRQYIARNYHPDQFDKYIINT